MNFIEDEWFVEPDSFVVYFYNKQADEPVADEPKPEHPQATIDDLRRGVVLKRDIVVPEYNNRFSNMVVVLGDPYSVLNKYESTTKYPVYQPRVLTASYDPNETWQHQALGKITEYFVADLLNYPPSKVYVAGTFNFRDVGDKPYGFNPIESK